MEGRVVSGFMRGALSSGALASLASAFVLSLRGRRELDDAAAPLNGPSQWVWGRDAPFATGFSMRHTAVGYGIHHLAATFWALGYEALRLRWPASRAAAATAVVASIVDFRLTPQRLHPGFEKRLSRRSVTLAYVAFALGLAAATRITAGTRPRSRR